MTIKHQQDIIEEILDHTSLEEFLRHLAAVCYAKAAHIQENWQDDYSAKIWDQAGGRAEAQANWASHNWCTQAKKT